VFAKSYILIDGHVLNARLHTTGITETRFEFNKVNWNVFDDVFGCCALESIRQYKGITADFGDEVCGGVRRGDVYTGNSNKEVAF
jgi:hypothetical protein